MIGRDVTQERAQRATSDREALLATAAVQAAGVVALSDAEGRLTFVNAAFLALTGVADADASDRRRGGDAQGGFIVTLRESGTPERSTWANRDRQPSRLTLFARV